MTSFQISDTLRLTALAFVLASTSCSSSGSQETTPMEDAGVPDGGTEPFAIAWPPEGASLERPRTLGAGADLATLRDKLAGEPYRTFFGRMNGLIAAGRAQDPADHLRGAERLKANAARGLATFYLLGWTVIDGEPVPFDSAADRDAVGAEIVEMLKGMYTESRIAVDPPLGGWDRDITTSEEIILWANAYDVLLGGGYDIPATDDAIIRDNLITLTSALFENYLVPATANDSPLLHQNNHRSKVGCAFIVASMVLAEHEPNPDDERAVAYEDPVQWAVYGFEQLEYILEYSHLTIDGVYSEGPFYLRYTSQNFLPMARAWDMWVSGEPWPVAETLARVSPWRDPRIERAYRWMLDVMLPDSSFFPYDDGNVGRRHYYGLSPTAGDDLSTMYWAWGLSRDVPTLAITEPYPTDGNIELAPDAVFAFDDSVVPRAPEGSPTRIYEEGGIAVLRSDWNEDGIVAVVLGERDTASSFGRGPEGQPVHPDSHEHVDPASFALYAYGERLLLDPGYLDFSRRTQVNGPLHHNMILVDGRGPVDYLEASFTWGAYDPADPAPADGMAFMTDAFDATNADGITVTTQYGAGKFGEPGGADIERRFVFASNRYLVVADRAIASTVGESPTFTWRFHGNGGGSDIEGDAPNEGTFERSGTEARWQRPKASVVVSSISPGGPLTYGEDESAHEPGGRLDGQVARSSHSVWEAGTAGSDVSVLSIVYPYPDSADAPQVSTDDDSIAVVDGTHRAEATLQNDGSLLVIETEDGIETLRYSERGSDLRWADVAGVGRFVEDTSEDAIEWHLGPASRQVTIRDIPFAIGALDGVCESLQSGDDLTLQTGGGRFGIRATSSNGRPAAVVAETLEGTVGESIALDGTASCDIEGSALTYTWSLTAAPGGTRWPIHDTTSAQASLIPDVPGVYRASLRVTDSEGATSDAAEVVIQVEAP